MAHYAFLDENMIVTEVIVGKDESDDGIDWEQHYANFKGQICKRTSYNTHGGQHKKNKTPFRKNYACIGFSYDEKRNAFIPPKPFPSWVLDEETCLWQPPYSIPEDGVPIDGQKYFWIEDRLQWVAFDWDEESKSWLEKNPNSQLLGTS